MRLKLSWLLFTCLMVLIIVALPLRGLLSLGGDIRSLVIPLGLLGVLLVIVSATSKTSNWLRFFFILSGASALGWPVSLWLHGILTKVWSTEPVTYVLVFFILPVTFIVGAIGTIVMGAEQLVSSLRHK